MRIKTKTLVKISVLESSRLDPTIAYHFACFLSQDARQQRISQDCSMDLERQENAVNGQHTWRHKLEF